MSRFGTAWTLHGDGKTIKPGAYVAPEERLSWPRTIGIGSQHVVAMFGATFLVPLLTGFPPATTLLFSGIGTILFLIITAGKVPSYLGSSFAFIAPITAATSQHGPGGALGGIIMAGAALFLIGLAAQVAGTRWIQLLMPPVVTGTIVALIGLNLAGSARTNFEKGPVTAVVTVAVILLATVLFRGFFGRLSILIGVLAGYGVAMLRGEVDFEAISSAAWFGLPDFHAPSFHFSVIGLFVPVVLVLVAENIGHVKSVAAMTGRDLDPYAGRALMADGLATMLAGSGGGSATTTYAENIGVMAASRVYSTAAYWVAGIVAVLLSLFPKFGALIATVPPGVLGGAGVVLYGMIGILGVRIWVDNRVNFSNPINLSAAGLGLIVAIADFTWVIGDLTFGGIALGTGATLVAYHGMQAIARWRGTDPDEPAEDAGATPSRLG
ncbi:MULTISPECIES: uracil-xanthine permease family protein [unclassified Arthrobacter]|uniref:uracil-xanthine permease family protein n=1 Tax=unclassified Arthrobacter TaxID=235627 RepID=UPI001D14DDCC|nr:MULTISPECIES: solute carrier family 23 protein [unclassified Arthrobacter]MCC3275818.1 NCS2 family nucleobase:cation symporter [Arthrobacter sp. zg-Y20]MCC9177131.1 NCS2 family nucleobase:cation symporter [Arthrobacter sp. zg-Y750]MDK1315975.1 solute carrier family 23 protein [Arthrobacter sp. zg.Y20]WIB06248.1 solute carrier family 23 protein [Arthrobacter sp. zg-Y20]